MPSAQFAITHDDQWRDLFEAVCLSRKTLQLFLITIYIVLQVDEGSLDPRELIRRVQEKHEFVLKFGRYSINFQLHTMYSQPGQAASA